MKFKKVVEMDYAIELKKLKIGSRDRLRTLLYLKSKETTLTS